MSTDEFDLTISQASKTSGRRRNNLTATTDPTADHDWILGSLDPTHNYEVGSRWINTVDGTVWTCVDSTTGAAVWVQGSGGGSGDLEDLETDLTVSGSKTVDRDDAPNHDLTLTGNTVLDATSTTYTAGLLSMLLLIRQDGVGGNTLDMSAFTWSDGEPTMPSAANALLIVPIFSWDNGASWMGITPGGSSLVALDDLTDATITAPVDGDMLRYESGQWVNTAGRYEPVVTDPGGGPEVVFADGDIVMQWVG